MEDAINYKNNNENKISQNMELLEKEVVIL